jgi:hypothetical protein
MNTIAKNLGVAASDIHLGEDASETTLKRTPLADYGIVYSPPTVSSPATSRPCRTVAGAEPSETADGVR